MPATLTTALPLCLCWAALCLGGSWWAALGLQSDLQQEASAKLQLIPKPSLQKLTVEARGLSLYLRGRIYKEGDDLEASRWLQDQVQLRGRNLRPRIVNELSLEALPNGWALLLSSPTKVQLVGRAASTLEAARLTEAVRSANLLGNDLDSSALEIDDLLLVECDELPTSLDSAPQLTPGRQHSELASVSFGEPWRKLDLSLPFEQLLPQLPPAAMANAESDSMLRRLVRRQLDVAATERAAALELARQQTLPLGHLILAKRADVVLLLGSLGGHQQHQELTKSLRVENARLLDEVTITRNRRPTDDVAPLGRALRPLPELESTVLRIAFAGDKQWTSLRHADLDEQDPAPQLMEAMGADRPVALAAPDVSRVLHWLRSIDSWQNQPTSSTGHLWLVAAAQQVYVTGEVQDEAARSQLTQALRQRYAGQQLQIELRVVGTLQPSGTVLATCHSLPDMPTPDTVGIVAFALPGDSWKSQPARALVFSNVGLQHSKLLPEHYSTERIMPDVLRSWPIVRDHLRAVQQSTHGIPPQIIGPGTR